MKSLADHSGALGDDETLRRVGALVGLEIGQNCSGLAHRRSHRAFALQDANDDDLLAANEAVSNRAVDAVSQFSFGPAIYKHAFDKVRFDKIVRHVCCFPSDRLKKHQSTTGIVGKKNPSYAVHKNAARGRGIIFAFHTERPKSQRETVQSYLKDRAA